MNSTNKKSSWARGIPQPFNRQPGHTSQFKPALAQLKTAVSAQPAQRPVAPPVFRPQAKPNAVQQKIGARAQGRMPAVSPAVYRPQPVPKVLQTKAGPQSQPSVGRAIRTPAAPPVYRPQPVPRVLQRKRPQSMAPPSSQSGRAPVAPPVYRPQPNRFVQPKMGFPGQAGKQSNLPPNYRHESNSVLQAKIPAASQQKGHSPNLRGGGALNRLMRARLSLTGGKSSSGQGAPGSSVQLAQRLKFNQLIGMVQQKFGQGVAAGRAHAPSVMPGQHPSVVVIQRKIGFELETDNRVKEHKGASGWVDRGRVKGVPMYEDAGRFVVETDTHNNMEFIIKEQDNWPDLEAAVDAAVALAEQINTDTGAGRTHDYDRGGNWKGKYQITVKDKQWEADGQSTQGVKLADIGSYLKSTLSREEWGEHEEAVEGVAWAASPAVAGLTRLIIKFVQDFKTWDGSEADEGPKNAQVSMHRTSYNLMYKSLSVTDKAAFKAQFFTGSTWQAGNPVTQATGVAGSDRVIPKKYLDVNERKKADLTTLRQWIESIFVAGVKDKMSAPAGWRGNYGMGLMDMDTVSKPGTALALFEYRKTDSRTEMGETSGKAIPMYMWSDWMKERYRSAEDWNSTLQEIPEDVEDRALEAMVAMLS